ncbi:MAG: cupredoxin domain-containing protein [Ardenticatenaceae bacterium]|nr:cupredoxin domain-containing protein [Ardenticatenaceae bacterium]
MWKKGLFIPSVFVLALLVTACGSRGSTTEPASAASLEQTSHEAGEKAGHQGGAQFPMDDGTTAVDQTIDVTGQEWGFEPATVTIPAGKQVRLVFHNAGKLPHEIAIDEMPATILAVQDPKAMGEMDPEEMSEMSEMAEKGVVHIHTAVGKSASEVFRVDKPGTYEFACEIPGHKEAGMVGKLVVK